MTNRLDVARGRSIVGRWCALAEQRLQHLTELFETGRWRRYHSEPAFLENIEEARAAVKLWHDLLIQEASQEQSAIEISWLDRARATLPRGDTLRDRPHRFRPPPAQEAIHVSSEQAPTATEPRTAAMDTAVIHERYPLLRNAL